MFDCSNSFVTFGSLTCDSWCDVCSMLQDSSVIGTGTFACGSTIVEGEEFIAENITFENSAPEVCVTHDLSAVD